MVQLFRRQHSSPRFKITSLSLLSLFVVILTLGFSVGTTLAAPVFTAPVTAAQGRFLADANLRIRKDGLAFLVGTSFTVTSSNAHLRNWLSLTVLNNGNSYGDSVNADADAVDVPAKFPSMNFSPLDGTGYIAWRSHTGSGGLETYVRVIPPAYNGTTNKTLGAQVRLKDKIGYTLDQPAVVVDSAGNVSIVGYAVTSPVRLQLIKLDRNLNVLSQTTLDNQPAGEVAEMDPTMCIDPSDNIHVITQFPYGTASNSPVREYAYSRVNSTNFVKTDITPPGWIELRGRRGKDVTCAIDSTVYVAVNNRGQLDLYKRTPGAGGSEKWARIQSNLFQIYATSVAVTVSADGKVWAAQADGKNSANDPKPNFGANVKFSSDGGRTFTASERAIPINANQTFSIAMDGNGPGGKVHLATSTQYGYDSFTSNYATANVNVTEVVNLATPETLTATAVSSNQVDLTWADKSDGEQDYRVERKSGTGDWAEIATVGSNSTTYSDTTANLNTTYTYRVRARRDATYTAYSNESSATTLGPVSLAFATQPGNAEAGKPLAQQPKVSILDKNGKLVTNYAGQVNLSISTNPGGATLMGNTSTVSSGVATFTTVQLDKPGNGYVLTASANPAATNNSVVSASFNITVSAVTTPTNPTPPTTPPDLGQDQRNAPIGLPQFQSLWDRSDKAIVDSQTSRSWTWGPSITGIVTEPYTEGGTRQVQYFDKTRMEQTPGRAVTNGLLAKELMTGLMQFGDNTFTQYPANNSIKIAGDQGDNQNPTYASFRNVSTIDQENHAPNAGGQLVNVTLNKDGVVGSDDALGAKYNVKNQYFDKTLQHNIPDVFWNFMNQTGPVFVNGVYTTGPVVDWLSTMGLPLSEAYWTRSVVAGVEQDVLVQVFERRVLTFTPSNPNGYKVEMGNVGQHYREWRKAVLTAATTVTSK